MRKRYGLGAVESGWLKRTGIPPNILFRVGFPIFQMFTGRYIHSFRRYSLMMSGEQVDSKNIRKHKNDVFRLTDLINPEIKIPASDAGIKDINDFVERMETAISEKNP